jgi:hypothetical protein
MNSANGHGAAPPRKMKRLFHRNVHGTLPPRDMKSLFHRNGQGLSSRVGRVWSVVAVFDVPIISRD